jgi:hypothetical protein
MSTLHNPEKGGWTMKNCSYFNENNCPFNDQGFCLAGKRHLDSLRFSYWRWRGKKLTRAEGWWLECGMVLDGFANSSIIKDVKRSFKNVFYTCAQIFSRIA